MTVRALGKRVQSEVVMCSPSIAPRFGVSALGIGHGSLLYLNLEFRAGRFGKSPGAALASELESV